MITLIESGGVEEYKDVLHALKTLALTNIKSIDKSLVEEITQRLQEEIDDVYVK